MIGDHVSADRRGQSGKGVQRSATGRTEQLVPRALPRELLHVRRLLTCFSPWVSPKSDACIPPMCVDLEPTRVDWGRNERPFFFFFEANIRAFEFQFFGN